MTDDAEVFLREVISQLQGATITDTLLAANSLVLYAGEHPFESGFALWFEPTWHVGDPTGVILGSRQAQVEEKTAHTELGQRAARLIGKPIQSIATDQLTHDIEIRFSEGYWLRTFVSDPTDEDVWHIRDSRRGLKVYATPTRYFLSEVTKDAANQTSPSL